VQPHQPLHFIAAVRALGDERELIRRSRPACTPKRVVADPGRIYQCRRHRRQHHLVEERRGEQCEQPRPEYSLESIRYRFDRFAHGFGWHS
jgi:hypothetical protein